MVVQTAYYAKVGKLYRVDMMARYTLYLCATKPHPMDRDVPNKTLPLILDMVMVVAMDDPEWTQRWLRLLIPGIGLGWCLVPNHLMFEEKTI